MTNLEWINSLLGCRAQGRESEFTIFSSAGQFDVVQRQQVGAKSRRKFVVLRQVNQVPLGDALRIAQEWEDSPLPAVPNFKEAAR